MSAELSELLYTTVAHVEPAQAFWGALFSIGASLVGGLISRPKAPTPAPAPQVVTVAETKTTPNIQEGVDAAKKAGFNPASAAKYGLIQGFQTQQTPFLTTNPKYIDWEQNNQYQNAKRSWLGGMISSAGSAFSQWQTQKANNYTQGLQNKLLESEIFRNNTSSWKSLAFNPSVQRGSNNLWLHKDNNGPVPLPDGWEQGIPTVTNPIHPKVWEVNPYLTDAETWETRHGDIAQEFGGAVNLVGDVAWNAYRYGSKLFDQGTKVYNDLLPRGLRTYGPTSSSWNNTLTNPNNGSGGGWSGGITGGGW